jgi:hypothetical protein
MYKIKKILTTDKFYFLILLNIVVSLILYFVYITTNSLVEGRELEYSIIVLYNFVCIILIVTMIITLYFSYLEILNFVSNDKKYYKNIRKIKNNNMITDVNTFFDYDL